MQILIYVIIQETNLNCRDEIETYYVQQLHPYQLLKFTRLVSKDLKKSQKKITFYFFVNTENITVKHKTFFNFNFGQGQYKTLRKK